MMLKLSSMSILKSQTHWGFFLMKTGNYKVSSVEYLGLGVIVSPMHLCYHPLICVCTPMALETAPFGAILKQGKAGGAILQHFPHTLGKRCHTHPSGNCHSAIGAMYPLCPGINLIALCRVDNSFLVNPTSFLYEKFCLQMTGKAPSTCLAASGAIIHSNGVFCTIKSNNLVLTRSQLFYIEFSKPHFPSFTEQFFFLNARHYTTKQPCKMSTVMRHLGKQIWDWWLSGKALMPFRFPKKNKWMTKE